MENNKSIMSNDKYRGIASSKHAPDKFIAQYFNKDLKRTIYIGQFDNLEDAIIARANHIRDVHDGVIDDSLPKKTILPKGVVVLSSGNYNTFVQYWYGLNKLKMHNCNIGTFPTIEEAVKAREDFIKSLF